MGLNLGIVGLPNVGKSTLFNALTRNDVLAANYPFATIEPNEGVVALPDPRLDKLAELFSSEKIVPAPVTFVDIAGIVKGASEGAGLGNKFLANIRECDAICQVVRVFADDDVVHVDGKVDPASDIEVIETELILADMQTLEKAVPRLEKEARNNKDRKPVHEAAVAAQAMLDGGQDVVRGGQGLDSALLRELNLMTTKPFLYVFNADESVLTDEARKDGVARDGGAGRRGVPGREDRVRAPGARRRVGRRAAGVDRADRDGPGCVGAGGFSHPEAADLSHRGSEGVPGVDDPSGRYRTQGGGRDPHRLREGLHQGRDRLLRRPGRRRLDGGRASAAGKVRMEGKDYVMADGDVVEFRFGSTSTSKG